MTTETVQLTRAQDGMFKLNIHGLIPGPRRHWTANEDWNHRWFHRCEEALTFAARRGWKVERLPAALKGT